MFTDNNKQPVTDCASDPVSRLPTPKYPYRSSGVFLISWYKLFGRFQPELPFRQYQPMRFGSTRPPEKEDPLYIFNEWKSMGKGRGQKGSATDCDGNTCLA